MIYTKMTKLALKICFDAHKNQLDKSGLPYVYHPFHVAEQMKDEVTTAVALLHDVVEDSHYTFRDLKNFGFPEEVLDALDLLTHDPGIPYMDYIRLIKQNAVASAVKTEDLRHNSDLTRLDHVSQNDKERAEKYKEALELLNEK